MVKPFQTIAKSAIVAIMMAATCLSAAAQNVPPAVSVTSPANNASYTAPATVTLTADATDADGSIAQVEFYEGTTLLGTVTSAPYALEWNNVPAGSYQLTAIATDNAQAATTSDAVTVTVVANTAPAITLTSPADNQGYTSPATILLAVNASDADGTVARVEFFEGTTLLATLTEAPYSHLWEQVPPGSYTLSAKVTDNQGAQTSATPVVVNVAANAAPTVSMTATPSSAAAPATITLEATASDSDGSISQVDFYNGSQLLGSATQAPYAFTWSNVAAGSYSLTAKAIDNAGTSTTSSAVMVTVGAGAAQVYFIEVDHLNTPRVITDSNNQVVWQWDNTDPFGANLPDPDPNNTGQAFTLNLRFPGQYYDKETGLHYNYFRDYDPQTGRYVESDPIGLEGGINTYAYVGGNPLTFVDPLGLQFLPTPWGPIPAPVPLPVPPSGAPPSLPSADPTRIICIISPFTCAAAIAANQANQDSDSVCPPVPGDLVGDQSDPRAGKRGKRHTSGPLRPEYGGTGDGEKDFENLTGGTGRPFPPGNTYPPGSLQGENGITYRPGKPGEGPRIDIPGNGVKPPETLHY